MSRIFQTDLDKRKDYLQVIAKNHPTWILRMLASWILILLAIGIFGGIGYVLFGADTTPEIATIAIFFAMGICLSCVPFVFGLAIKRSAKYNCAAPYSGMTNVTLIVNQENIEIIYWQASKNSAAAYSAKNVCYQDEDKFVYRFEKSKIKSVKIDRFHVCCINGDGTLTVPMWASSNDSIETKSVKNTSFLMSFSDENCEKIILNWRDA